MNKVALALLVATASAGIYARDPYVYDVEMKVKTTIAKQGKVKTACQLIGGGSNSLSSVTYRRQGTVIVKGLIWGCECDTFAGSFSYVKPTEDGCYFWNVTDARPLKNGIATWPVFNRIDKNMKKTEGTMELVADGWHLLCGGFGSADAADSSVGRLINIKGSFGGWRLAPTWTYTLYGEPCTFCDSGTADVTYEEAALAWAMCACAEASEKTTAFGTWSIKYNRALSAKLRDSTSITDVYSFPSYVKAAIDAAETPSTIEK